MNFGTRTIAVGLFVTTLSAVALAHDGATGIVKERMDGMSAMASALKSIGPMVSGQEEFDPMAIRSAAEILQIHAGENLIAQFPDGSQLSVSQASDAVWSNSNGFADLALQLELYAKGLEAAADNIPGSVDAAEIVRPITLENMAGLSVDLVFKEIGKTCSACHSDYRVRN